MSLFSVALKRAVRKGHVVAKCGACGLTMRHEEHRIKAKCEGCGMAFDPVYLVPENVVKS